MFTKTGNSFLAQKQYAAGISRALHLELGDTHQATKTLMRWTNANERTVKNWMAGSSGPRGEHLVALIKHSDLALAAFLGMADRPHALTASELPTLRQKLQVLIEGLIHTFVKGKGQVLIDDVLVVGNWRRPFAVVAYSR